MIISPGIGIIRLKPVIIFCKCNKHVHHVRIECTESMQALLNLKLACDCTLLFKCDSVLLLQFKVAHSFWNIEELGKAMEFLYSLDMAA